MVIVVGKRDKGKVCSKLKHRPGENLYLHGFAILLCRIRINTFMDEQEGLKCVICLFFVLVVFMSV